MDKTEQLKVLDLGDMPLNIANTTKLRVMVKGITGGYTFHPVKKRSTYLRGSVFEYKYNKKINYTAIGRDMVIPLVEGIPTLASYEDLIAGVNLFGERPNSPGEELAVLIRTHIRTQATKTIAGKTEIPWKNILIVLGAVVILAVIGLGVVKPMLDKGQIKTGNNNATVIDQTGDKSNTITVVK
jgi:hypothetical protein